jgi:RNA-directed DNA polymerase
LFFGNNYYNNLNGNYNLNNNGRLCGIAHSIAKIFLMKTFRYLWESICSIENLELAFKKARRHKTRKMYVIEFEQSLAENLLKLRGELLSRSYSPAPLRTFIICDPKIRTISKSAFRDRVVHHALCNIIEPIFEKRFIHDSYANRKGKGSLEAVAQFERFQRKVSKNNTRNCFVLKADVRHYFESIGHDILRSILSEKIKDPNVLWLIDCILANSSSEGKGMPLGNLTSQFLANVYLNEFDQFIKRELKIAYYIRYVDDFVILHDSESQLEEYRTAISQFLGEKLSLFLHPDKTRIFLSQCGTGFLGYRIFPRYKLLQKKNLRKFARNQAIILQQYNAGTITYDEVYDFFEGWLAFAKHADTYRLRQNILAGIEPSFLGQISSKELDGYIT